MAVMLTDPVVDWSCTPPDLPSALTKPTYNCRLGVEFNTASAARAISTPEFVNALAAARSSSSRLVVKACSGVSLESRLKMPTQVPGRTCVLMNSWEASTAHFLVCESRLWNTMHTRLTLRSGIGSTVIDPGCTSVEG